MDRYITEAVDEFLEEMMRTIETLAGNHLFKVDEACVKLCERDKIVFHWLVSNLLFLIKRAQLDINPTIAFLTTRVQNPDKGDWKKIRRVPRYLDATINSVKLHLNANNLNVVRWWVDASYGTHPYLKGQIGATIFIGKG